jgi:hypothetical protein
MRSRFASRRHAVTPSHGATNQSESNAPGRTSHGLVTCVVTPPVRTSRPRRGTTSRASRPRAPCRTCHTRTGGPPRQSCHPPPAAPCRTRRAPCPMPHATPAMTSCQDWRMACGSRASLAHAARHACRDHSSGGETPAETASPAGRCLVVNLSLFRASPFFNHHTNETAVRYLGGCCRSDSGHV